MKTPEQRRAYKKQWKERNGERLRELDQQRRLADPERFRSYKAAYYQRNKDRARELARRWRESHRERYREQKRNWWHSPAGQALYRRHGKAAYEKWYKTIGRVTNWSRAHAWRLRHPERWAEIHRRGNRRYHKTEKGKLAQINANHRRRSRVGSGHVTRAEWCHIIERQNNRCLYCCRVFSAQLKPTQDHVIPLSRGGLHEALNIVAACLPCNRTKGAKCA